MIEEASGTRLYESKKEAAQKTIEKKDAKLKEIDSVVFLFYPTYFIYHFPDYRYFYHALFLLKRNYSTKSVAIVGDEHDCLCQKYHCTLSDEPVMSIVNKFINIVAYNNARFQKLS